jgi:hypothetical protein
MGGAMPPFFVASATRPRDDCLFPLVRHRVRARAFLWLADLLRSFAGREWLKHRMLTGSVPASATRPFVDVQSVLCRRRDFAARRHQWIADHKSNQSQLQVLTGGEVLVGSGLVPRPVAACRALEKRTTLHFPCRLARARRTRTGCRTPPSPTDSYSRCAGGLTRTSRR